MRFSFATLAVLFATTTAAAVARADTLTLNLGNPVQTGSAGSTLTFSGTASTPASNRATEYLNGDNYFVNNGATLNDAGFFNGFPLSLDPGQSYSGIFFTVTLPSDAAAGSTYTGFFSVLGGADASAVDTLATVNFSASTPAAVAATPEPSSLVLLGSGVLGAAFLLRRHRSKSITA